MTPGGLFHKENVFIFPKRPRSFVAPDWDWVGSPGLLRAPCLQGGTVPVSDARPGSLKASRSPGYAFR